MESNETPAPRRQRHRIFCHMDSFPRGWNDDGDKAIVSQAPESSRVLAIGWFGSLKLDLADEAAVRECIEQTRAFANMLEEKFTQHREGTKRGELISHG